MDTIKQDRITLLRELLVTQMNHWTFFPLYVMLFMILGDVSGINTSRRAPLVLFWLAFGTVPFLLYLGRTKLKKFLLLVLEHVAVIAVMFLIPTEHIVITALHITFGVVYVILSGYLWTATKNRQDIKLAPFAGVALSIVMLMILHNQNHSEWNQIFVTVLILVLCMYFIIYYIEQYQNFLTVNSSSAGHIPAKAMFQSGVGLVLGYTGVGLVLMILISNVDWLKYVLNLFKNLLAYFVSWFFSLFPRGNGEETSGYKDQSLEMMEDMMPMEGLGESFWLWNVLESILVVVIFAGILFFAVKGIRFLIKFIQNKLHGEDLKQETTAKEDSYDVREKCEIIREREWKSKIPFFHTDPKERIRHLYKKRLVASKSSFAQINGEIELLNRITARESSKVLEREQLALLYEKARYSNEDCSNEDVKQMKQACK
uniref:hypothetical protein n=1 Tax=Acetatifactor sp. TaxID=1872090 RepID=UPI0040564D5B